jgi:hypothetical protein
VHVIFSLIEYGENAEGRYRAINSSCDSLAPREG